MEPVEEGTRSRSARRKPIRAVMGDRAREAEDEVAAEEPLEIRVLTLDGGRPVRHSIAVTMRTPGHDFELAAGFLFSEGIVASPDSVRNIAYCQGLPEESQENVVNVTLAPGTPFDPERFSRNVYTTSSCGICGKASIEMVRAICPERPRGSLTLDPAFLSSLPEKLAASQLLFSRTGGIHASALFDHQGAPILVREDVGRHNALDKVVGSLFLDGALPASDTVVLVSGRASYELVQKSLMAGIPVLAAVGAPSTLAVETAQELGMTLVGFLRDGRFNIYAGQERIRV